MDDLDELCAVDGVAGREDAPREEAELKEGRDRLVLGHLGRPRKEPAVLLCPQPEINCSAFS